MIKLRKIKKLLDFTSCFRVMLKDFFYLFLINGFLFSPAFAHFDNKKAYQKVIRTALLDVDLKMRIAAENTLNNLSSVDTTSNTKETSLYSGRQSPYLKNLRAELLSVFPEEQIKALKSLKDIENEHPLIQYIVIKEFVFKPSNPDIQKELVRIAESDSYLQKWLIHVSGMDTVSDAVRDAANSIVLQVKPDLEFQNKLLNKAISDESASARHASARQKKPKNTLIKIRLDFNFQKYKLLKSISDRAPAVTRKVVKYVLSHNPYIDLKIEQYLVSAAISDEVSSTTQKTAQDILSIRKIHLKTQERLSEVLASDQTSDKQKKIAADILARNKFIHADIDKFLVNKAISDKTSSSIKAMIRRIFHIRTMPSQFQQTLLGKMTSDEVSDTTQIAARDFLIETELDLEFEEKLLHIIKSPIVSKKVKKMIRAVLTHNRFIHPDTKDRLSFFSTCRRAFFSIVLESR